MRIATVLEYSRYTENRQSQSQQEIKRRKEKKDEQLSFSEILRKTQQNTYSKSGQ